MRSKPLNGPFSRFFYESLRNERIKPRRLKNPKGIERFTFSVSTPRQRWARDLYYDKRALANLDHAVGLVPKVMPAMVQAFGYTIEHEKVHAGDSKYQALPVNEIKKISNLNNTGHRAQALFEQVANRGVIAKMLTDSKIKSLQHPSAKKVIADKLSWYIIQSLIQSGEFRRMVKSGLNASLPKTKQEARARIQIISLYLKKLFPNLENEHLEEIIKVTSR